MSCTKLLLLILLRIRSFHFSRDYETLNGEGRAKSNVLFFLHKYTLWQMSLTEKDFINFLPLPFAQETSFFSAFLHGFNSGSKNSSVVGGAM